MKNMVTKDDLKQFRMLLLHDIGNLIKETSDSSDKTVNEWMRSKTIRRIMDISPATLQNLRISGKIRFKKIMGSYYYNGLDLEKLFNEE